MALTALIGSSHLGVRTRTVPPPAAVAASGAWRFVRREENIAGLSWMVAIAASFLLIGVVGLFKPETPLTITLTGRAGLGASDANTTELTMAELHAMEDVPEVVEEQVPPEVVELVDPVAMEQDLPELAEVLQTEDVFTIPAAPRIEEALKPVDPAKPKPKAQSAPPRPRPTRAATTASGTQGGTQGSGGGSGGTSSVGSGSGKGRFPEPNYPSSARARGVAGHVTLALSINPSGAVESASAISSQGGFTSSEQDSVASFVRRNWHFPTGPYRKHTVNIVFKLRGR